MDACAGVICIVILGWNLWSYCYYTPSIMYRARRTFLNNHLDHVDTK
jgi:hypothetical protein